MHSHHRFFLRTQLEVVRAAALCNHNDDAPPANTYIHIRTRTHAYCRHEAFEEIMVPIPSSASASASTSTSSTFSSSKDKGKGKAPLKKQASGIGLARTPVVESVGWMAYLGSFFEAVVPSAAVELRDCLIENFSADLLEGQVSRFF